MGLLIDSSVFIPAGWGRLGLEWAVALDFQVATADARDFPQSPNLQLKLWWTR